MGNTRDTGFLRNIIAYDASGNVGIGGAVNASYKVAINGTSIHTGAATFSSSVTQSASDSRLLGGDTAGRYIISNSDTSAYMAIYGSTNASANVIGLITNSYITFTTGSGYSERMRITSSGNVGIGTSSPSVLFEAYKTGGSAVIRANYNGTTTFDLTASSGGNAYLSTSNNAMIFETNSTERMRITSTGSLCVGRTSSDYSYFAVKASSTNNYSGINAYANGNNNFIALTHDNNVGWVTTEFASGGTGHTPMAFATGGSERMRITSGGNVGIGITSPATKLHVNGAIKTDRTGYLFPSYSGNKQWELASDPTIGDGAYLYANGVGYLLKFTSTGNILIGDTTGDSSNLNGSLLMGAGNAGTGQESKKIIYVNNYSSATATPHFVGNWMSAGTWGIGADSGANDNVVRVGQVTSNTNGWYFSGTYVSLRAASFPTGSDYRLKRNVLSITNSVLDSVIKLNPVTFELLTGIGEDGSKIYSSKREIGFIAHDVQSYFPEVVTGNKDEVDQFGNPKYQAIEYSRMTSILTKAIQEEDAKVEDLKAEVAQLKERIAYLENK